MGRTYSPLFYKASKQTPIPEQSAGGSQRRAQSGNVSDETTLRPDVARDSPVVWSDKLWGHRMGLCPGVRAKQDAESQFKRQVEEVKVLFSQPKILPLSDPFFFLFASGPWVIHLKTVKRPRDYLDFPYTAAP